MVKIMEIGRRTPRTMPNVSSVKCKEEVITSVVNRGGWGWECGGNRVEYGVCVTHSRSGGVPTTAGKILTL